MFVILIGVPVGYAMGRWWRVQAFFTDIVTVGLALPAYMWALLAVMWFGFGIRAPVFCAVVSATPGLIVHVLQGASPSPATSATCRTPTTCPARRGCGTSSCPRWPAR